MEEKVLKKLTDCLSAGVEVALVTVTRALGSSPRDVGSMMLVDKNGQLIEGTIGGGKIEETAKADAAICIKDNSSKSFQYELTLKDSEHSLGMACGGAMEVFVKTFAVKDRLVVFGGGHIGLELSKVAPMLGYHLTIVDHRPEYCSKERFPGADQLVHWEVGIKPELILDQNTSVVIVTHGHLYDMESLREVIHSNVRYIGMIGSKNKIKHCYGELIKEGIAEEKLKAVYAPIGLDIGGETPEEIAVAIMAEVQAVKYGRSGGFLSR